jgi:hypothetical protein
MGCFWPIEYEDGSLLKAATLTIVNPFPLLISPSATRCCCRRASFGSRTWQGICAEFWSVTSRGLSVTDFVCRFSIIPLVALASRTPLPATRLEHDGGNPDVPRHVHHVAGPSGLSAPATPDGREGKARVSWRFGGR